MATNRRSKANETELEEDDAFVYVFDRRDKDLPDVKIPTGGLFSFEDFKDRVREVCLSDTEIVSKHAGMFTNKATAHSLILNPLLSQINCILISMQ